MRKYHIVLFAVGLVSFGFILGWIKGAYDATMVNEEMQANALPNPFAYYVEPQQ